MEKGKNHRSSDTKTVKDGFMGYSRANPSILPSPAILESYEEISPGMVDKLVEMVEKEQKHRHRLEERKLRANKSIFIVGQFLSLLLAIAVLVATLMLVNNNNPYIAIVVAISGFGFLSAMVALSKSCKTSKSEIQSDKRNNNAQLNPVNQRDRTHAANIESLGQDQNKDKNKDNITERNINDKPRPQINPQHKNMRKDIRGKTPPHENSGTKEKNTNRNRETSRRWR